MRRFLVDTATAVTVFTMLATLSELLVAGMTPREVAITRTLMLPVMVATGRPYGLWRDAVLARIGGRGPVRRGIADTAAFLSFQVPLYLLTLRAAGTSGAEMAWAVSSATLFMLLIGRPYGALLDRVRAWAGVSPGADRSA